MVFNTEEGFILKNKWRSPASFLWRVMHAATCLLRKKSSNINDILVGHNIWGRQWGLLQDLHIKNVEKYLRHDC